jgi:DNA modification methylase
MELDKVYLGDCIDVIRTFPDECVNCVVTSPPYYGLRDYGVDGQIGLEDTPEDYIGRLVELFREIRRVLKKDGTVWVNLGDSYAGNCSRTSTGRAGMGAEREGVFTKGGRLASKQLMGIPWRFAFAMQEDGWYLRQDIIWHKPNPMPESVTDRCTKSHEYIFLLSKSEKYFFDHEAIQEEANIQEFKASVVGGDKYGKNDDPHFNIYSGKAFTPQVKMRWGSGTKAERTVTQGYGMAGGHRDNSGGFDCEVAVKDGVIVRNKRDVWTVALRPTKEAHFATYPQTLVRPCILAGCPEGGVVLDPFMGSGTTGIVAMKLGRHYVGVELNPEYRDMAERRITDEGVNLFFGADE